MITALSYVVCIETCGKEGIAPQVSSPLDRRTYKPEEKVNAQRRKYQQTRGNYELRDQLKTQYLAIKAKYPATTKKERSTSWKEICNKNSATNPWDEM